jgi:hypothetical protein
MSRKRNLMKQCPKCGEVKNINDFYYMKSTGYYCTYCKECEKERCSIKSKKLSPKIMLDRIMWRERQTFTKMSIVEFMNKYAKGLQTNVFVLRQTGKNKVIIVEG